MVNPKILCRQHLLGEHVECHMFLGCIKKRMTIDGYVEKGLVNTRKLKYRHDKLAKELQRRGYNHKSPLIYKDKLGLGRINKKKSLKDLLSRCKRCKKLYGKYNA